MGLYQSIHTDPVAAIELRELLTVPRDATVRQATELMRAKHLGCVFVLDDDGKPIGKFTERLLMKLLCNDASDIDAPIRQFMYTDPNAVAEDAPIEQMLELMESRELRFVCVVDAQGRAKALAGQKGLMEYIADHFPRQVKVQLMEAKLHMEEREGA